MNSIQIGSALKAAANSSSTFSTSPFVPYSSATSFSGNIQVSRVHVRKAFNWRSNPHLPISHKLLENANKQVTEIHRNRRKLVANVEASEYSEISSTVDDCGSVVPPEVINEKSIGQKLAAIYNYSRAYTLKGTVVSIISISLLAVKNLADITPSFFLGILQAIFGGCLANLYVVGINQLSDIEIDKLNKPYLPLASGELSVKTAILLTSLYAILGFCLGWFVKSWPLKLGLLLWYAFGTAYSVDIPLLRWKKIPVLAAMCLWSVQGAIVPILFHLHAQTKIQGRALLLSKHAIFVSGFMSIYAIVIALFKDIPDIEGDKMNGINSLASQVGQKTVFWICIGLIEMAYGMAILFGLSSTRFWVRLIMVCSHIILGFILWRKATLVDLNSNDAIESFYLFIWKLYYAEYLLVPILRF